METHRKIKTQRDNDIGGVRRLRDRQTVRTVSRRF